MHATLVYVLLDETDVDQYVATRRSRINPAMAAQPGFDTSVLLRPRDNGDLVRLALLNSWTSAEAQRRWVASPTHAEMRANLAQIVRGQETRRYHTHDDSSVLVGDPESARMCSIGIHRAVPGRGEEYLTRRREIANVSMRDAPGFIGTTIYVDPDEPDHFVAFFQWESDAAADEYFNTPEHRGPVYDAIRSILTHEPTSQRYDVLLRHA